MHKQNLKDKDAIEIQRIYVLKKYYGKSIGQFLLEQAVAIAKERHCKFICQVYGEKIIGQYVFTKKMDL